MENEESDDGYVTFMFHPSLVLALLGVIAFVPLYFVVTPTTACFAMVPGLLWMLVVWARGDDHVTIIEHVPAENENVK